MTLPQVYSEHPDAARLAASSNLGMYRVQISGNDFDPLTEVGLHYQIHRGIGVHHSRRRPSRGERLRVNVCVGGPPALDRERGDAAARGACPNWRSPGRSAAGGWG